MRHLTAAQLVDIADGSAAETAAPHLQTCEACRRQLADLQSAVAAATAVEVPEPSPLFWDRLSDRVREAVAAEAAPRAAMWRPGNWPRLVIPAAGGALIAVALAAALTLRGPTTSVPAVAAPSPAVGAAPVIEPGDDPSLNLVADLASQVDWDVAGDVGLPMHAGAVDDGIADLTPGERREMQRLLQEAIRRPGA
jgi:hypothetical protein